MQNIGVLISVFGSVLIIQGCISGTSSPDDSMVIEGSFPVAFVQRNLEAVGNPTDGAKYSPGGELLMKEVASPSAPTINITANITGPHDVSDPEVSYDGKKLLFSMRAPQWNNNTTWNIFEYDLDGKSITRLITTDPLANAGDDVDPAYLPDGRIVFSSNRQQAIRDRMANEGKVEPYSYRDEYEREASMVLHVLHPGLQTVVQISVNQSHDRNPTVLMSGQIMFARWDHVGNRNHFPLFTTDPDGTNMFVQYGAFSPGNSFLHPREMPDGRVMSSLMPLSGTDEGGALMIVDVKNFTDNNQPANDTATGNGQVNARAQFPASSGRDFSEFGRFTTPNPLWDGTNRALVAFKPNPKPENAETQLNVVTGVEEPVENPPRYGIYMFDLDSDELRPIALPDPAGELAYTDPVPVIPRDENCLVKRGDGCLPSKKTDVIFTPMEIEDLKNRGPLTTPEKLAVNATGILNVKSVYDTDGQDLMGVSMLVSGEDIPMKDGVPDLKAMKTPGNTAFNARVARFVRVGRAVPTPPGLSMEAIGESDLEMQEILGYAPIEPDGSFRVEVPADTPLTVSVVDAQGRAIQTHTNWIQVRPGETRTCNGCHSPRRGSAVNGPGIAGDHAGTLYPGESGETMAETRTRLLAASGKIQVPAMALEPHMLSTDFWTNVAPTPEIELDYDDLTIPSPLVDDVITINYEQHIQPLWDQHCVTCHNATDREGDLDLSSGISGEGRLNSYQALMIGELIFDTNGLPLISINEDGEVMMEREAPLVATGDSRQSSRSSHLMQELYESKLRAPQEYAGLGDFDHRILLNGSEKRLIAEWIDLGAQYRNDPFEQGADASGSEGGETKMLSEVVGGVQGLSETGFEASVHSVLMDLCASCHQGFGNTGGLPELDNPNPTFVGNNRFVLTGNTDGDFNVTVGMVTDVCKRENNPLLARPISAGTDPVHPSSNGAPVLTPGSQEYNAIRGWIDAAAVSNGC